MCLEINKDKIKEYEDYAQQCIIELDGDKYYLAFKDFNMCSKGLESIYFDYIYTIKSHNLGYIHNAELYWQKVCFSDLSSACMEKLGVHSLLLNNNYIKTIHGGSYEYSFLILIPCNSLQSLGENNHIVSKSFILPSIKTLNKLRIEYEYIEQYTQVLNHITGIMEDGCQQ